MSAVAMVVLGPAGCGSETPDRGTSPTEPISSLVSPTAGTWTMKAPMPTPRSEFAIATVPNVAGDPVIYVIGGLTAGGDFGVIETDVVEAYDPLTDTWSTRAPMPKGLFDTNGATVFNGNIYVVGGWTVEDASPTGGFYEYDPIADSWRTLLDFTEMGSGSSQVINGLLYVTEGSFGAPSLRFKSYNFATGRWDFRPELPRYHTKGASATLGGKFYLAGGSGNPSEIGAGLVLDVFDPASNKWFKRASMLVPREQTAGAFSVAGSMSSAVTTAARHWRILRSMIPTVMPGDLIPPTPSLRNRDRGRAWSPSDPKPSLL